jgi:hypothetical protein
MPPDQVLAAITEILSGVAGIDQADITPQTSLAAVQDRARRHPLHRPSRCVGLAGAAALVIGDLRWATCAFLVYKPVDNWREGADK